MMASSKQRHRSSSSPPSKNSGGGRKGWAAAVASSGKTTRTRKRSTSSFPYRLYQLLEDVSSGRKVCTMSRRKLPSESTAALGPCVGWSNTSEGSFLVYDSDAFMDEVACDYFKMTKYRSFVSSELNIWGFHHVMRRGYDEWHHPSLVRGDPSSCDFISRTNATDTIGQQPPAADRSIAGQKMRTISVYPSPGITGTYALPSIVESLSGGPPHAWNASGGMSSQYLAMAVNGVSSMAPGMVPSLPSHTEISGGIGSGEHNPFSRSTAAWSRCSRGGAENATARKVVSADAACDPSLALSEPRPISAERDDVTGNLFYPVVGDQMDPFDDISIEDPSNPSIEAPVFKSETYEEQLFVKSRSQEEEGKKKGTASPPASLPASKRRRSSELTGSSSDPGKLNEARAVLQSSFLEASDPLVGIATFPVGNGNPDSLSLPNGPPSGASAVTAPGLAHGMSLPAIPSNAGFDRSDFLFFLDNMIDLLPSAAAAEVATVPAELKVLAHFDHAAAVREVNGGSNSLS